MKITPKGCTAVLLLAGVALSGCSSQSSTGSSKKKSTSAATTNATNNGKLPGATVAVSALATPRGDHTATNTQQGVVVIGGENRGQVLATIEIFENGRWVPGGTMPEPRKGHSSTLLPNGKILIAGGQTTGGMLLTSSIIFDPATRSFLPAPALSQPRSGHTSIVFKSQQRDFVLLAGGVSTAGRSVANADVYELAANRISALPTSMTMDRVDSSAVLLRDGRVLIQGGLRGFSSSLQGLTPASAEIFDPSTMTFRATSKLAVDRYGSALALNTNGAPIVVGGHSGTAPEGSIENMDARSGKWTTNKARLSVAREGLSLSALSNGNLLAIGGSEKAPTGAVDLLAKGVVTVMQPLQIARRSHTTTALANGHVLVVGGFGANGALASAEEYDAGAPIGTQSVPPAAVAGTPIGGMPGTLPTQQKQPKVLAMLPNKGKPGDIITIAGSDFAPNRNDNQVIFAGGAKGKVLYDIKIKQLPVLGTVQTLVVEVPNGMQSGDVVVISRGMQSRGKSFTLDMQSSGTPKVFYTFPRRARAGGMVTIFGRNFARPSSDNKVMFSGAQAPARVIGGITTQSVPFLGNVAVMVATVPADAVTGDLTVDAYGQISDPHSFEVTGTTPAAAPSTGTTTPPATGTTTPPATGTTTPPATGTTTPPASSSVTFYAEDFENATVNMSTQGTVWEAARPGQTGPTSAASGDWCAGTNMIAGQYDPGANGYLMTTEIDLTQATVAELRFNQFFDTDGNDGGRVIVSPDAGNTFYLVTPDGGYMNASVFNPGEGFSGSSGGWLGTRIDLTAFTGERIVIAFEFAADGVDERAGWFLDDIEVVGQ